MRVGEIWQKKKEYTPQIIKINDEDLIIQIQLTEYLGEDNWKFKMVDDQLDEAVKLFSGNPDFVKDYVLTGEIIYQKYFKISE